MRRTLLAIASVLCAACTGGDPMTALPGDPVRLVAGEADTVILNTVEPARLSVRVLDAAGRALPDSAVRYRAETSDPRIVVSRDAVTCVGAIDALVRVSLGALETGVMVRCRPVHHLLFDGPVQLHFTGTAQRLPVRALDAALRPVQLLRGMAVIGDHGIASLDGITIQPRSEGATVVTVYIGDRRATVGVHVYAPVASLDELSKGHRLIAVALTMGAGEMQRWTLPRGEWMLTMLPEDDSLGLRLRVEGANCSDGAAFSRRRFICKVRDPASVTIYHPRDGRSTLNGELLIKSMGTF